MNNKGQAGAITEISLYSKLVLNYFYNKEL